MLRWVLALSKQRWQVVSGRLLSGMGGLPAMLLDHMHPRLFPLRLLQSSFVHDLPPPPRGGLVHKFFSRPPPPAAVGPSTQQQHRLQQVQQQHPREASAAELEAVEQLQAGVVRLQEERAQVARLRLELEEQAARLGQEQAAFEKRKVGAEWRQVVGQVGGGRRWGGGAVQLELSSAAPSELLPY